ncbi:hypothetical protein EGT74_24615 [Chitinophaga lutea]|uniref:Uncharacterized protein n=1 Tax=Chitinophaga lutea TaxID=2488634 RepID=A0A3N4PDR6_9BACT|nr:hypothetical protein [Chitinophaga lutea]RPE05568.1 hypothetical protein EGT74_24615 [Chitinophaga lutea]
MKKNSKEFEELRAQFEHDLVKGENMPYVGAQPEREPRDSHYYYTNGQINDLFIVYMAGYQNAKCLARIGDLNLNE